MIVNNEFYDFNNQLIMFPASPISLKRVKEFYWLTIYIYKFIQINK